MKIILPDSIVGHGIDAAMAGKPAATLASLGEWLTASDVGLQVGAQCNQFALQLA